ncbi:protein S100-A1-like [Scyliorhinus canicula]|uniref:protein S100-A1-like n=1 Tax=Scyliorhinus canicula TaxID=7830 RepID=UPI0018F5BF28|nr:protein S100-A1-like [Scyliorhinus canicula]
MSSKLSDLEMCMQTMMMVFHKYASKDADEKIFTLSTKEMKDLLTKELGCFMKGATDAEAVNSIVKKLDSDRDGEVNFQEFVVLVASICVQCNDLLIAHVKQQK